MAGVTFIIDALNKAGPVLKEIEGQIENTGKKIGELKPTLDKLSKIGAVGFGAISGAIGLNIKAIDDMRSAIAKGTGAFGDELDKMEKSARQVAKVVPQSFGDVGAAMAEVNTRLGATGKELEDTTKLFLDFARVNDLTVKDSVGITAKMMNDLDLEVKDVEATLDKLVFMSQKSGIGVEKLAQHVIDAGPAFQEMGFSFERQIALFSSFEKAGARPEEVISSLGMVLNNFARQGATNAEEAWSMLFKSIKDAPDIITATGIAIDNGLGRVSSKVAEDIRAGRFEIDEFVASLEESEGVLARTADESKSFGERLLELKNNVGVAMAPLSDTLIPVLEDVVEKIANVIEKISDWIEKHPELTSKITITALVLTGALGVLGFLAGAISNIIKLGPALKWLWVFALTNPLGQVILAIMAGIVIGWLLAENWDKIKEWLIIIWESIVYAVECAIESMKKKIENFVNFFIDKINIVIRGLNKLQFQIGGKEFGINISEIKEFSLSGSDMGSAQSLTSYLSGKDSLMNRSSTITPEGVVVVNNISGVVPLTREGADMMGDIIGDSILNNLRRSTKL